MPTTAETLTTRGDFFLIHEIFELVNGWDPEYPPPSWSDDGSPSSEPCVMDLNPALADRINYLLTEAFERFAPNVELQLARDAIFDSNSTEAGRAAALDEYVAEAGQRHASRLTARALRQRMRDADDA